MPARALSAEVLGHELVPRGGGMSGVARKIQIRAAWRMESRTGSASVILVYPIYMCISTHHWAFHDQVNGCLVTDCCVIPC